MKIVKGLPNIDLPTDFSNVKELILQCINLHPNLDAYWFHDEKDRERTIRKSYRDLYEDVLDYTAGLLSLGRLTLGEHFGLIGNNSYPWVIAHSSTMFGLGVNVPLDKLLAVPEAVELCRRGKVKVLAFDYDQRELALSVAETCPEVHSFILLTKNDKIEQFREKDTRFFAFEEVKAAGHAARTAGDRRAEELTVDPHALAAILFTSGTTNQSKGVMLSQHNLLSNVKSGMRSIKMIPGTRALSVLPLHHTLESGVGMHCLWASGVCICINENLRSLSPNINQWKIHMLIAVPLLFQGMYRQIQKAIDKKGMRKKVETALKISRFLFNIGIDVRRRLFKGILEQLGGNVDFFVNGAAALPREVQSFFNDIGILTISGYGLTECSPMLASCHRHVHVDGSVGPPVYDVTLAIADAEGISPESSGEVLAKGDNIMLGYYEDPEATKAVFTDDGWFRTGDLGYFGEKDCLFITGRAKSMIVLTNGKKVFPEELETILGDRDGISSAMVFGERNRRGGLDLALRLQVDRDSIPGLSREEVKDDAKVSAWLSTVIGEFNDSMTSYKKIQLFIWDESEPIMTTTKKIRRAPELERIHAAMQSLGIDELSELNRQRLKL